jgi:hypothetical protein
MTTAREKRTRQDMMVQSKKSTTCEVIVFPNSIFGRIFQYCATRDQAAFTAQRLTTNYPLTNGQALKTSTI